MISDKLKDARQKWVTGLKGSSHLDAWAICMFLQLALNFRDSIIALLCEHFEYFRSIASGSQSSKASNLQKKLNIAFLIDFMTLVMPNIVVCVFADQVCAATIGLVVITLFLQCLSNRTFNLKKLWTPIHPCFEISKTNTSKKTFPCLSSGSTMLMIGTTISILFVDFTIYPRSLAKTEEFGISLMDIGTGAVIYSGGISYAVSQGNQSIW